MPTFPSPAGKDFFTFYTQTYPVLFVPDHTRPGCYDLFVFGAVAILTTPLFPLVPNGLILSVIKFRTQIKYSDLD
jgi:hypothetical protein